MKNKLLFLTIVMLTGCATNTGIYWEKQFETNISARQAEAQCDYEYQQQRNAEQRAGYQRGAIQIFQELSSDTNPTIKACMNRYGYKARKTTVVDGKLVIEKE
jgi:acetylglutamate kinase